MSTDLGGGHVTGYLVFITVHSLTETAAELVLWIKRAATYYIVWWLLKVSASHKPLKNVVGSVSNIWWREKPEKRHAERAQLLIRPTCMQQQQQNLQRCSLHWHLTQLWWFAVLILPDRRRQADPASIVHAQWHVGVTPTAGTLILLQLQPKHLTSNSESCPPV